MRPRVRAKPRRPRSAPPSRREVHGEAPVRPERPRGLAPPARRGARRGRRQRRRRQGHVRQAAPPLAGPQQHKQLYRDARKTLIEILEYLMPPPPPPPAASAA